MRRVRRTALPAQTESALARRQQTIDDKKAAGTLNVTKEWEGARKTKPLKTALGQLRTMAGKRERCMYCGDSHGTDIEHFWPKARYPQQMFRWPNMLLCCTECGRFKGDQFPLDDNGLPMLVDPSADNPWDYLDFNPDTCTFVARFDLSSNAPFPRGLTTIDILQLDRREAMEAGYRKTHRRILALAEQAVEQASLDAAEFRDALCDADDHGLIGWYFLGTGARLPTFARLRSKHPEAWDACTAALAG